MTRRRRDNGCGGDTGGLQHPDSLEDPVHSRRVARGDAGRNGWAGRRRPRPGTPDAGESNWIQTVPGKGWFLLLRLYGPLEPWFDQSWVPGDIERVQLYSRESPDPGEDRVHRWHYRCSRRSSPCPALSVAIRAVEPKKE